MTLLRTLPLSEAATARDILFQPQKGTKGNSDHATLRTYCWSTGFSLLFSSTRQAKV